MHILGADNARHWADNFPWVIFDRLTILCVIDDRRMDEVVEIFEQNGLVFALVPNHVLDSAIGQAYAEGILPKRIPT